MINRRTFLAFSGAGLGLTLIDRGAAGFGNASAADGIAILYDSSLCVGCRACQMNCKITNNLPSESTDPQGIYESPRTLSAKTWNIIQLRTNLQPDSPQRPYWNKQCMHCTDAACVEVCPTGALYKHAMGFTAWDEAKCNGCGYCTQACPFKVASLRVINIITGSAKAARCTFCQDRILNGLETACVAACPVGALIQGPRQQLLQKAKERVAALQAEGITKANLYGEFESGGLHRLSILSDDPSSYALVAGIQISPFFSFWKNTLNPLGRIGLGGTILGLFIAWLVIRRNIKMEEVE
jgi:formate dehydrogenase iron-sulfur subunit